MNLDMNLHMTLKMQDLIKTRNHVECFTKHLTDMSAEMVSKLNMQVMERFDDDQRTEPSISMEEIEELATDYENFKFLWNLMMEQIISLQGQLNRG